MAFVGLDFSASAARSSSSIVAKSITSLAAWLKSRGRLGCFSAILQIWGDAIESASGKFRRHNQTGPLPKSRRLFADALAPGRRLDKGERQARTARLAFANVGALLKLLTANRWALSLAPRRRRGRRGRRPLRHDRSAMGSVGYRRAMVRCRTERREARGLREKDGATSGSHLKTE